MRTTQQYSITLPIEMAAMIERKIEQGYYASMSEAVRDGIRTLMDKQMAFDTWLQEDVVKAYEESMGNPDSRVPADDILKRIQIRRSKGEYL